MMLQQLKPLTEQQWLNSIHFFVRMESRLLLKSWCKSKQERELAEPVLKAVLDQLDDADWLEVVDHRIQNPNTVQPWVLCKIRELGEPAVKQALRANTNADD